MCFTGPCFASNSRIIFTHSFVGATGLCTHNPPLSNRATVMRTLTSTSNKPCNWSNIHTSPGTASANAVVLLPYGASGSAHQYGYHRSGAIALDVAAK